MTISKSQTNRLLKKKYGKQRKIRKVFYLKEAHKKKSHILQRIVRKENKGKNIFYIDETIIDLILVYNEIDLNSKSLFLHHIIFTLFLIYVINYKLSADSIHMSAQKKNEGKENALNLITVQEKKNELFNS